MTDKQVSVSRWEDVPHFTIRQLFSMAEAMRESKPGTKRHEQLTIKMAEVAALLNDSGMLAFARWCYPDTRPEAPPGYRCEVVEFRPPLAKLFLEKAPSSLS